ncbi:hypothetical protein AURDEDRAFT_21898, partial [Auricularia subglabra TFB-10046 SS5]
GDGTIHEILNAVVHPVVDLPAGTISAPPIHIVLLPLGTSNALYYSLFPGGIADHRPAREGIAEDDVRKLQSVLAFIAGASKPLALARTKVFSHGGHLSQDIISCVVTSTSLHASILDSAEKLRKDVPRLDRFQLAARENISKWYHARATLLPRGDVHPAPPQLYDPGADAFEDADAGAPLELPLAGPFTYFVSTLNVDRLEPKFRVVPLHRSHPPAQGEMDLIIMRPMRNPCTVAEGGPARSLSALTSSTVLKGAYDEGSHLKLKFDAAGLASPDGDGPYAAEYYRCGGWIWEPESGDEDAHLVCADGTLVNVPSGGKAVCRM